jgi:hypothetical protein
MSPSPAETEVVLLALGCNKDATVLLQVTPGTTPEGDIKRAYKKLALRMHPDKNSHPDAAQAFQILQSVFEAALEGKNLAQPQPRPQQANGRTQRPTRQQQQYHPPPPPPPPQQQQQPGWAAPPPPKQRSGQQETSFNPPPPPPNPFQNWTPPPPPPRSTPSFPPPPPPPQAHADTSSWAPPPPPPGVGKPSTSPPPRHPQPQPHRQQQQQPRPQDFGSDLELPDLDEVEIPGGWPPQQEAQRRKGSKKPKGKDVASAAMPSLELSDEEEEPRRAQAPPPPPPPPLSSPVSGSVPTLASLFAQHGIDYDEEEDLVKVAAKKRGPGPSSTTSTPLAGPRNQRTAAFASGTPSPASAFGSPTVPIGSPGVAKCPQCNAANGFSKPNASITCSACLHTFTASSKHFLKDPRKCECGATQKGKCILCGK